MGIVVQETLDKKQAIIGNDTVIHVVIFKNGKFSLKVFQAEELESMTDNEKAKNKIWCGQQDRFILPEKVAPHSTRSNTLAMILGLFNKKTNESELNLCLLDTEKMQIQTHQLGLWRGKEVELIRVGLSNRYMLLTEKSDHEYSVMELQVTRDTSGHKIFTSLDIVRKIQINVFCELEMIRLGLAYDKIDPSRYEIILNACFETEDPYELPIGHHNFETDQFKIGWKKVHFEETPLDSFVLIGEAEFKPGVVEQAKLTVYEEVKLLQSIIDKCLNMVEFSFDQLFNLNQRSLKEVSYFKSTELLFGA